MVATERARNVHAPFKSQVNSSNSVVNYIFF